MSDKSSKPKFQIKADIVIFALILIIFAGLIIASTYNRHRVEPEPTDNNVSFQYKTYSKDSTVTSTDSDSAHTTLININTATVSELDELPGIGLKRAQQIVDYRENVGNFKTISDIKNVEGIGDGIFNQIKDFITVD